MLGPWFMNLNPISSPSGFFFSEKPNLVIEAPRIFDPFWACCWQAQGFLDDFFAQEKDRETEMVADMAATFVYIAA